MSKTHIPTRIFIVEDDPVYARMVKYISEMNPEHEVHLFSNGKDCLANLHLKPTIISLDYSLSDITGEKLLRSIKKFNPNIAVIILSGQKDISVAVELLKNGAYDYIGKDDQTKDRLYNTIENIKKKVELEQEVLALKAELSEQYAFDKGRLLGKSKPMRKVIKMIQKSLNNNISVSITGETGTGKEVVARTIHFNSSAKNGKFVAVNVSAIPRELLESELFGYEKGAFTGANTRKLGQFELADKGTLFLDEIAELDINMQAKLLRAIQEREIQRVGGTEIIPFDTRIIVATHRDLAKEVELGNFREDLYYRLLGLPITLPPLRERGNDLFILVNNFLEEFVEKNKMQRILLSKGAKEKLMQYTYPGNIRELKAVIELATVICEDNVIEKEHIIFNNPRGTKAFFQTEKSLRSHTLDIINYYLQKYDHDVRLVAKKLGIGKSTIYRLLKEEKEIVEASSN